MIGAEEIDSMRTMCRECPLIIPVVISVIRDMGFGRKNKIINIGTTRSIIIIFIPVGDNSIFVIIKYIRIGLDQVAVTDINKSICESLWLS